MIFIFTMMILVLGACGGWILRGIYEEFKKEEEEKEC